MHVAFRRFTEDFKSWDRMLAEVAAFATSIGRENLINISCSEYGEHLSSATVVVWYWE
jgi:hypothetical protein